MKEQLSKIEKEAIIEAIKHNEIKISNWKDCGVSICKLCSGIKKLRCLNSVKSEEVKE